MQACYFALLYDGTASHGRRRSSPWLYATLQHVSTNYDDADSVVWQKIEEELTSFTPATVSGATQQAAKLSAPKDGEEGKGKGKKRKAD